MDTTAALMLIWILIFGGGYAYSFWQRWQQAKDDAFRYKTAYKLVRR
jgi:predicted negative regulator of RcsB-dependent stress response